MEKENTLDLIAKNVAQILEVTKDIPKMKEDMTSMKGDITSMKTSMLSMETRIGSIETEIKSIKIQTTETFDKSNSNEKRLEDHEERIGLLEVA